MLQRAAYDIFGWAYESRHFSIWRCILLLPHTNKHTHAHTHTRTHKHTHTQTHAHMYTLLLSHIALPSTSIITHLVYETPSHTETHCNTLQHTATHCNTLQHTATHCNTLQHTATHCNTLQHTFYIYRYSSSAFNPPPHTHTQHSCLSLLNADCAPWNSTNRGSFGDNVWCNRCNSCNSCNWSLFLCVGLWNQSTSCSWGSLASCR